jgi:hypothetical protein
VLGLVATGIVGGVFSQAAHAEDVKTIKIGPRRRPLVDCVSACLACTSTSFILPSFVFTHVES